MKTKTIFSGGKRGDGHPIGTISEETSLADIERAEPAFFHTTFGKRETFTIYRGQLIVRHTVRFSGEFGRPGYNVRMTVVYLFFPNGYADNPGKGATYNISAGNDLRSIRDAQKLIDQYWDGDGKVWYGYPIPEQTEES